MTNKRGANRFSVDPLEIHGMISVNSLTPICDYGEIVEASSTGFKLIVKRQDLCGPELRSTIDLSGLCGEEISLYIPMMDLDITGCVARAKYLSNKQFEIGIDYSGDAPEYWRECLCDLLPRAS